MSATQAQMVDIHRPPSLDDGLIVYEINEKGRMINLIESLDNDKDKSKFQNQIQISKPNLEN